MVDRPTIKMKSATRLVGQVEAGDGITVVKDAGVFTVSLDGSNGFVAIDGDTMTGNLTISGSAAPVYALSPSTGATKITQLYQNSDLFFIADGTTNRVFVTLASGSITAAASTAIPAGGTAGYGVMFSTTTNFGVFFGSNVPSLSAAKGSLYLRSDGGGTNDRMYVNTDGGTTWTPVVTVG